MIRAKYEHCGQIKLNMHAKRWLSANSMVTLIRVGAFAREHQICRENANPSYPDLNSGMHPLSTVQNLQLMRLRRPRYRGFNLENSLQILHTSSHYMAFSSSSSDCQSSRQALRNCMKSIVGHPDHGALAERHVLTLPDLKYVSWGELAIMVKSRSLSPAVDAERSCY